MTKLIKISFQDLRFVLRKMLLFEFFYMMMLSLVFIPAIAYFINRLLRMLGNPFLLNHDVYQIGLSLNGLIWGSIIVFSCVVLLFIQFGVILLVSQKHIFGKHVYITDAFLTTLRSIPKLISIGFIPFTLFVLFLLPFIRTPLSDILWGDFNFPIILASMFESSWLYVVVAVLFSFIVIYCILRWIFVLHFILIEGMSVRLAIINSSRLSKSKEIPILLELLLLNAGMIAGSFALLSALGYFLSMFEVAWIKYIINHFYLPFTSFMTYVLSFVIIPVNIVFITRLFYRLRRRQGIQTEDHVHIYTSSRLSRLEKSFSDYFRIRKKRYLLFVLCTIYAFGTLFLSFSFHDQLVYLKWNVQIAAHRGDSTNAPENSMSSIRHSIENNIDAIEIDVQMSQDGVVVLNHDYSLNRVAGVDVAVHELQATEIAKLQIGDEHIPTLEEVLSTFGERAHFIIELKPYGDKERLVNEVVKRIEAYDLTETCRIQSSDYTLLQSVRKQNPDIKIGQILYLSVGNLARLDVDFYTVRQTILSENFIQRAHRLEREVWVWTVNIERNMKEVLKYDVDGIITDYPRKLQSLISIDNEQEFLKE